MRNLDDRNKNQTPAFGALCSNSVLKSPRHERSGSGSVITALALKKGHIYIRYTNLAVFPAS